MSRTAAAVRRTVRRTAAALAYAGTAAIPAGIFTGAFGPLGFLAVRGLAVGCVVLLVAGVALTGDLS